MQRIHQKIIRALFSACAVSILLGACDSPTTPRNNPDSGQQGQQGQKGGGGSSGGGSGGGSGSGSGSRGGLQNNQGPRGGGGVQADEGSSTVPSGPTMVKVTVKTIAAVGDGHKKVEKTGGGDFDAPLEVTVNKSPLEYGFVEDTVAELAKELKGKTAVLAAGEIYKFTEDDKGEKVVTAASLIGPSKTIYVSIFKEKVTIHVKTIDDGVGGCAQLTKKPADYSSAKEVPITVAHTTKPTEYKDTLQGNLAAYIARQLGVAEVDISKAIQFSSANNSITAPTVDNLTGSSAAQPIYVGHTKKVTAKITLKMVTGTPTFTDGAVFKGKTLAAPAGAVASLANNEYESEDMYPPIDDAHVQQAVAKLLVAVKGKLTASTDKIVKEASEMTGATNYYAFFKKANPSTAGSDDIKGGLESLTKANSTMDVFLGVMQ